MAKVELHTGPGVFEVLAHVCRSPQEALRQFVENAADAIQQAGIEDGSIRLTLSYRSDVDELQGIAIEDNGVGISLEKMKQVLQRIGDSEKINMALRGEKGIGILAFSLIADEMHLASSAQPGRPSSCLALKRSWLRTGHGEVRPRCQEHEHATRGTIAYLEGILPEIAPQFTRSRIKDYLGQQFASDLHANLYSMFISDGRQVEQVHPQHFRGVKAMSTTLTLDHHGSAFVELYILPWEMPDAAVCLYGRAGMRICQLTDVAEFKRLPWQDQRVEGYIRCDRLARTADKTALVQDEVFCALVAEIQKLEPRIQQLIVEISAESQEKRFNVILGRLGKLINKYERYRDKGLLANLPLARPGGGVSPRAGAHHPLPGKKAPGGAGGGGVPLPPFQLQSPPGDKSDLRSWYDPEKSLIYINREHEEFLLSQREDRRLTRYLFSVWAKETILQEYGDHADKVADELVGVLAEAEPLLW